MTIGPASLRKGHRHGYRSCYNERAISTFMISLVPPLIFWIRNRRTCARLIFLHAGVAAVQVQAIVDGLHLLLGGPPFRHRGRHRVEIACDQPLDAEIDEHPAQSSLRSCARPA